MKLKKWLLTLVSLVVLAGCGKQKNTFKYVGLKVYDPVYVAIENGIFKKNELDVELIDTVAGGPTGIQLVASGSVHAGLSSLMAIINSVNADLPIIATTDLQSSMEGAPLEVFFVREDAGYTSVADLKGKTIAINLVKSSFHYSWIIALEQAGLKETDVTFVVLSFAEQLLALQNGLVDAIGLMTPYNGVARATEGIVELFNALDVFGEKQFTTHFVNSTYAKKHPERAKKFVSSIVEAMEWIEAHQEEAKVIMAKYVGIEAEYIDDYLFQPDGMVNMDDVAYWLDFMKERDDLDIKPEITPEMVGTNDYNEKVK